MGFVAFSRIFFKASDLSIAAEYFAGLARFTLRGQGIDPVIVLVTIGTIAMNFVGRPVFEQCVSWHARLPAAVRPLTWIAAGVLMLAVKSRDVAPYIYFGF